MTRPFSDLYQDYYFSAAGGVAEKQLVFVDGNDLPQRFAAQKNMVIVEAGFGTGLGFLLTLKAWVTNAQTDARLHFISFEKHPLSRVILDTLHQSWRDELGSLWDDVALHLPPAIPGWHRCHLGQGVDLTLVYGDLAEQMGHLNIPVDAWFLDGFAPAKNPDMWGPPLWDAMRAWSAPGATAATYSAARMVKDGLKRAGFEVQKQPGFGFKSDRLTARFLGPGRPHPVVPKMQQRVLIYGGGLAGTAAAWHLKQRGHYPVIVAPNGLADGASGNGRGLINPRFAPRPSPMVQWYAQAYAAFLGFLGRQPIDQTGWQATGIVHVDPTGMRGEKIRGPVTTWGWDSDMAQWLDHDQMAKVTGLPIAAEGLWLPRGGSVDPRRLCHFYAADVDIVTTPPASQEFDAVIAAHGLAALKDPHVRPLPLRPVRGQVTHVAATPLSQSLKTALCYGGYITPSLDGHHVVGATFDRDETDISVTDLAHQKNLQAVENFTGLTFDTDHIMGGRAGIRVTTPDYMPFIGHLGDRYYCSLAHGSHGILGSYQAGVILAQMIENQRIPGPASVMNLTDPGRYLS